MKAALGTIPDKYVYSAYLGERPLASIYQGTTKIWPDNAQRVTRMTLDVASLDGTLNGIYWQLALDAVDTGCTASKFIRFTCDRTYNVNHTYGSYPLVYHMGNGEFSFLNEQGPLARNVHVGDAVAISLVIPSRDSIRTGGLDNVTVSYDYHSCIPGTTVRGYFNKGRKKVSTGVRLIVASLPSNKTLLDRHQQQNGHVRGDRDWEYGSVGYIPGETGVRLTVTPHQPVGGAWGGYFRYPAFRVTLHLNILRIETTP